jgi:transcriptional regulator CtsR
VCYFHEDSEDEVMHMEREQKKYIERNVNYLKEKGYAVDDKRLTTGRIEIARLDSDLTKEELLNRIKNFNHIQSLFLS